MSATTQQIKITPGTEWINALCASLGVKPNETSHIIVDIPAGLEPVSIYIEMFGTERTLKVIAPLASPARIEETDVPPTASA